MLGDIMNIKVVRLVDAIKKYPCVYNHTLEEYSKKEITEIAWRKISVEVNEPVKICKEKWKNLRTVFVRRLKLEASGECKSKKPYYLSEKMQFVIPFLKPNPPQTGSLEHMTFPQQYAAIENEEGTTDNQETTDSDHIYYIQEDLQLEDAAIQDAQESENEIRIVNTCTEVPCKKREAPVSQLEKQFIEFVPSRTAMNSSVGHRNNMNSSVDHRNNMDSDLDHRKMFLLSLLPEIAELTEGQMKKFKRQVLQLIDRLLSDE